MSYDYDAAAGAMDRRAAAAWGDFERGLSRRHRAELKGLPAGEVSSGRAELHECVGAVCQDMAAALDGLEDELRERFGLSREQAAGVAAWHRGAVTAEAEREKGVLLVRIVGKLIEPTHNLPVVVWALALASGIASRMNGVRSEAQLARELGVTRALVSHWKLRWADLIGLKDFAFRKSPEAREKYREARLRVVARGRMGGSNGTKGNGSGANGHADD